MDKRKIHFGISKGLCGEQGSWRTNRVTGTTCKHCLKRLEKLANALSS
jgi:hypothetical protein